MKALTRHFSTAIILLLVMMVVSYLWPENVSEEKPPVLENKIKSPNSSSDKTNKQPIISSAEIAHNKVEDIESDCKNVTQREMKDVRRQFRTSLKQYQSDELKRLQGWELAKEGKLYDGPSEELNAFREKYVFDHINQLTKEWRSSNDSFLATLLMEYCLKYLTINPCEQTLVDELLKQEGDNAYIWLIAAEYYYLAEDEEKLITAMTNAYSAPDWVTHRTEFMIRIYAEMMAITNYEFYAFSETHDAQRNRFKVPRKAPVVCTEDEIAYLCLQLGKKLAVLNTDRRIIDFAFDLQRPYLSQVGNEAELKAIKDSQKLYDKTVDQLTGSLFFPNHPEFASYLIQLAYEEDDLKAMQMIRGEAERVKKQYPDTCMMR